MLLSIRVKLAAVMECLSSSPPKSLDVPPQASRARFHPRKRLSLLLFRHFLAILGSF